MYFDMRILLIAAILWRFKRISGERWGWPEQRATDSVRIDSKVRFFDVLDSRPGDKTDNTKVLLDVLFRGAGGAHQLQPLRDSQSGDNYEDVDEEQQRCKCTERALCPQPLPSMPNACADGKILCCFKRVNTKNPSKNYFNDVNDERPGLVNIGTQISKVRLYPSFQDMELFRPSQSANSNRVHLNSHLHEGPGGFVDANNKPILYGPDGPTGYIGLPSSRPGVLVGPEGPTGLIGPPHNNAQHLSYPNIPNRPSSSGQAPEVLVGPDGPTGIIGPNGLNRRPNVLVGPDQSYGSGSNKPLQRPDVLVGPGGPTGVIGPKQPLNRPDFLVGPGGPTGIIGPNRPAAQPDLLVGPGGPTGIIGPARPTEMSGLLVGPGGPTGIIGPNTQHVRPNILVGPGGPTGIIGSDTRGGYARQYGLLTGPGGPTGTIGPRTNTGQYGLYRGQNAY